MSRVGKLPIEIPNGVNLTFDNLAVSVDGIKGKITKIFKGDISLVRDGNVLSVIPNNKDKKSIAMWGTVRSIVSSMVKGVSLGYTEELEINGVGYRVSVKDNLLSLSLGKSHSTKIEIPSYIKIQTPKQNVLILESFDKEKLGQFIAILVKQRPPEPYKGKGIKKKGQFIQRKEGKKN